jgi:hypothetical protein
MIEFADDNGHSWSEDISHIGIHLLMSLQHADIIWEVLYHQKERPMISSQVIAGACQCHSLASLLHAFMRCASIVGKTFHDTLRALIRIRCIPQSAYTLMASNPIDLAFLIFSLPVCTLVLVLHTRRCLHHVIPELLQAGAVMPSSALLSPRMEADSCMWLYGMSRTSSD